MARKILKILGWVVLALVLLFAFALWRNCDTVQRVFLGGVKVYETEPPTLPVEIKRPAILVFSKTNGFRHDDAIPAANALFGPGGEMPGQWEPDDADLGLMHEPHLRREM